MSHEFKRIKKRKFEDVSPDEIDKWRDQIEEKIRNMQDVPSSIRFYHASNEVLPGDLDIDSRREIVNLVVKNLPPDVREMIKVEPAKAPIKKIEKVFTPEQLKWMAKSAQRKIWREEKRSGQPEEDSDLI